MPIYFTFAITLLNGIVSKASLVLLALYALHLGAQPFDVGLIAATYSALPMLLSWQVGKLADRFGSRWMLLYGSVGAACGMVAPYLLPGLPAIYLATVMNGLSHAFTSVSLQNLVGLLSTPDDRPRNFSNFSLVVTVGSFIGPLLSGFSIDIAGHGVACLFLVVVWLLPIGALALRGGALPTGSRAAPHRGGVRDMIASSGLWRVLITSSLVITGIDLFQFYMPIYGHSIGLSASATGMVIATFSVAAFLVRLTLSSLVARFTAERILVYSFFIGAASLMMVPFFKNAMVLSLISFAFGLGMGCGQPITIMMTFSNSAEGRSGEAMGVRLTVNHLTRVIVPLAFGLLGSAFGMYPVFFLNAALLASGGVVTRPGRAHTH